MRAKRVSVFKTKLDFVEDIDRDQVTVWMVLYHGIYPTYDIAVDVCRAHQCSTDGIRALIFYRTADLSVAG